MNHQQIRQSFLDFFQSKSHQIVSSAPVVPQGDSSLIFTNAGMNQFKDIFLGSRKDYPSRVANTQKCIRVSGKHNDLEEVGVDTYHHTFFEMLGNWSFGDYYKKEAIEWAWELLTKEWKLPIDKLYITVYQTDDKTAELWAEIPDLAKNRILRFGEKDNFWEMGDTGPCGPCSEIHMDLGDEACDYQGSSEHICEVNGDCSRYMEIWNLVFIQYNRNLQGQLEDLVNKHVDTGMGFERICSILQNKKSNYDTDIFTPIIDEISRISGKKYRKNTEQIAMRVIADHLRAVAFSIADGVVPSNEGRGYVIRRILRRAYRYGRNLDLKGPFIYRLVPVLVREMGDYFTELKQKEDYLIKLIETEEKAFHKTLDKGLNLLEQFIAKIKQAKKNNLSGKDAFVLYDTYGFPFDLTQLILKEQGLKADENSFHREMEKQKKIAVAKQMIKR